MHDRAVLQVLWDGVTLIPDEITPDQNRRGRDHGDPVGRDEDPAGRRVSTSRKSSTRPDMPLRVVAGPGCDAVSKDQYLEDEMQDGDVVISIGRIFEALTETTDVPSSNPPALRMALGLRTVAIRSAREKELSGFVLTSNGNRADLDRLVEESGASGVTVLKMTEAQACARVAALVPKGERRAACVEGIRARWSTHE